MSQVFVCECGRRTTDPYIIRGKRMCVICAEDEAPSMVDARERMNTRKIREAYIPTRKYGNRT